MTVPSRSHVCSWALHERTCMYWSLYICTGNGFNDKAAVPISEVIRVSDMLGLELLGQLCSHLAVLQSVTVISAPTADKFPDFLSRPQPQ